MNMYIYIYIYIFLQGWQGWYRTKRWFHADAIAVWDSMAGSGVSETMASGRKFAPMWNEAAGRTCGPSSASWVMATISGGRLFFFRIRKVETNNEGQFDIVCLLPPTVDGWMDGGLE